MIVERKQYGCIQVLLVQIGLALYLIVIFLGTGQQGESTKPQILRIQKVAEAGKQVSLSHLLPSGDSNIESTLSAYPQLSAPQTDTEKQILSLIESEYISVHQSILPIPITIGFGSYLPHTDIESQYSTTIHTLGTKPRAPSQFV